MVASAHGNQLVVSILSLSVVAMLVLGYFYSWIFQDLDDNFGPLLGDTELRLRLPTGYTPIRLLGFEKIENSTRVAALSTSTCDAPCHTHF